jgi:hypothetical protein
VTELVVDFQDGLWYDYILFIVFRVSDNLSEYKKIDFEGLKWIWAREKTLEMSCEKVTRYQGWGHVPVCFW